jgi:hypothetical protein
LGWLGILFFCVWLLAACQSTPTLVAPSTAGLSVGITDDLCPSITAQVGQQIMWTNQGKQDHIVKAQSANEESKFASGILKPGDSFGFTLTQPISYTYTCSEDGTLVGTITVEP